MTRHARLRAALVLGVALLAPLAGSPLPAGAAKPDAEAKSSQSKAELEALRGRIEALQKSLNAAEETRSEAADQLRESEKAVSEAQRALYALGQQARATQAELDAIAQRERAARSALVEQELLAGRLLRLQYFQGAPDRLRILLEGRDASEVARHLEYLAYIQRARAGLIADLRKGAETLSGLQREAAERRDRKSVV